MLERWKSRARLLKKEAYAVYLAAKDPRTPWYAKALVFFVLAHSFVTLYEEPTLKKNSGADYEEYCRRVPRWAPKIE